MPDQAAMAREMQRIERERREIFGTAEGVQRGAFPTITTPAPSSIDLEQLAARYERKAAARKRSGLMAFASFAMPPASLKRLIADVAKVGGVVVLRGFKDGSIKSSSAAIADLQVDAGAVQINPNAFTQYRVAAVPAIVLVAPDSGDTLDAEGCALPASFVKVAGDVTLAHAVAEIEKRSAPFRDQAAGYGRRLAGGLK